MVTSPASFFMAASGAAAYDSSAISNSVWLDGSADHLTKSFSGSASSTEGVYSIWVQRNGYGTDDGIFATYGTIDSATKELLFAFRTDNKLQIYWFQGGTGSVLDFKTTRVFRDIGWYHILFSYKTDETAAADRAKLYINGILETAFDTKTDPSASFAPPRPFASVPFGIGVTGETGALNSDFLHGYVAQATFLDGQSIQGGDVAVTDFLDSVTFGTNGSQLSAKKDSEVAALASAAGANSFCLDFSASSDLGNDISSKNNDFSPQDMAAANQSNSTPSLVYPIINAIDHSNDTLPTLSEGNLRSAGPGASRACLRTTIPIPTTGKWYWEAKWNSVASARIGFAESTSQLLANCGQSALSWGIQNDGKLVNNNSEGSALFSWSTDDIIAMAYDADNSKFWFGRIASGTTSVTWASSGNPETGANATVTSVPTQITPALDTNTGDVSLFFPEEDWTLSSKLSGFKEINSENLTSPDYQGIDYFDATLYEGNGTGQRVGDFVPFTDAYTVDNSAMFEHDDARYLSRTIETPSSSGGKKGTWSAWFKTANIDTDNVIFDNGTTATNRFSLNMDASGQLIFSHGGTTVLKTSGDFKGDGAWHNVVLKVDTELDPGESGATPNRAIMFIDGVQLTSTDLETTPTNTNIPEDEEIGYMDPGATQFVGSYNGSSANQWDGYLAEVVFLDNQYLNASSFGQLDTSTNRWVPKSVSGLTFGDCGFYLEFEGAFGGFSKIDDSSSSYSGNMTNGGGLSAAFDGNRIKNNSACAQGANTSSNDSAIVVNHGSAKTVTKYIAYGSQEAEGLDGDSGGSTITLTLRGSTDNFSSSDVQLHTTTTSDAAGKVFTVDSGITSGAYQYHKLIVQTNTTNSGEQFGQLAQLEYYETATTSAGTDSSGNSNNFTEGGSWETTDQFTDTPSKNFAIIDFYHPDSSTATTFSEGNLKVSMGTAAGDGARGTLAYNGKMYWEVELDAISTNSGSDIGIATRNHNLALTSNDSSNTNAFLGVSSFDSNLKGFINSSALDISYGGLGNNFGTAGKYLMFAVDTDAGKFWAGYDGTFFNSGNPAAGTNDSGIDISAYDTWFPAISRIGSAGSGAFIFNFGQRSFAHTPPTGFSKLNQDNLDDTASKITAWAWIKNRDATDNHILVDRVRGVGKVLSSNNASAEATNLNTIQRFFQRGVQVGSDAEVNTANESFVLWQWLLGDSATTGSSITTGSPSLTTTGIVADADHFSIISYTGSGSNATVAHGLSAAPEMYWVRDRTDGNDWNVYADGADASPASGSLRLDSGASFNSDGTLWNGVPTASLINLGTSAETNELNKAFIAYCFRSVPGVCKIGTYTGNGDGTGSDTVDGPYVSCGFRPRWILFKWVTGGSLSGEGWVVKDTARQTVNPNDDADLIPSGTNAEAAGATHGADILADGFKIRGGGGAVNKSGATYLYMAMADIGGNGTLPPIYGR